MKCSTAGIVVGALVAFCASAKTSQLEEYIARDDAKRVATLLSRHLASPAADYIHGVVLPVDGGWLAR
jgi:NAD(P)-dependent dehydrogenase (short-subunit alcohol dehydrogenase family)